MQPHIKNKFAFRTLCSEAPLRYFQTFQKDAGAPQIFPEWRLIPSPFSHDAHRKPLRRCAHDDHSTRELSASPLFSSPLPSDVRAILFGPSAAPSCGGAYLGSAAKIGLRRCWGVVQLVGHLTVNEAGEGSNPSAPAKFLDIGKEFRVPLTERFDPRITAGSRAQKH
jgi:hypothetical protein